MPATPDEERKLPAIPGFQLEKELGRGGVGVVYLARQDELNRRVALKMLLSKAHSSAMDMQRFHAEAESMASLQHPNLVMIYQIGRHEGLPFLVMEYLPNGTLAERFKNGQLRIEEAIELIAKLAEAAGYCHEHGIIHRDLKPANILFTADGVPKITDFGLAKRLEQEGELTTSGTVLGTPNYMAPEQSLGQTKMISAASDVWSLGVMLYEAITGSRPFAASTIWETLEKVQKAEFIPPRQHRPELAEGIERIILHCLQLAPQDRYATGNELAADLRRFLAGQALHARRLDQLLPRRPRRLSYSLAILSGMVFLTILAILYRQWPFQTDQPLASSPSVPTSPATRTVATTASQSPPTMASPPTMSGIPTKKSPPTVVPPPIEPAPDPRSVVEVAPAPLLLPMSPDQQADFARRYWWEAHRTRPLSRRIRLLEAAEKLLDKALMQRDGQQARHASWRGVSRLSLPQPDHAGAAQDFTLARQSSEAEQEPLFHVLRGLLERHRLLDDITPEKPRDLSVLIRDLNTSLEHFRTGIQRGQDRGDRPEDQAVALWIGALAALELADVDQSSFRTRSRLLDEVRSWISAKPTQFWTPASKALLESQLLEQLEEYQQADSLIREQLTINRDTPDLWLVRGRLLVKWATAEEKLEELKDAEKALIRAKELLDPHETAERSECLYWLAKAQENSHRLTLARNESLDFDPTYLRAIQNYQELLNMDLVGRDASWYKPAAKSQALCHIREASRLIANPLKSLQLLAVFDSCVKRASLPFRDSTRGQLEWAKVLLRQKMQLQPSGTSWKADLQSTVDLGTQPATLTQDRAEQAELLLMLSKWLWNQDDAASSQAIAEAEKAALLADTTPLMPAKLKGTLYAWLGQLHYRQSLVATPADAKLAATQKAILNLRKAVELGGRFPEIWQSRTQLAELLQQQLTDWSDPAGDLGVLTRIWGLIQQAQSDPELARQPDAELSRRLQKMRDRFAEHRKAFRIQLDKKPNLMAESLVLAKAALLEMDLLLGTPPEQQLAQRELAAVWRDWRQLLTEWPANPRRDQLQASLQRLEPHAPTSP